MNLFRSDIGINLASNVLLALLQNQSYEPFVLNKYSVILSVVDPRKFEYLKDYSLDFEHAYMTTYLAS